MLSLNDHPIGNGVFNTTTLTSLLSHSLTVRYQLANIVPVYVYMYSI